MTISLRTDRSLIRARGRSERFVLTSISAPAVPARGNRLPVNVALVLDRSGSMAGSSKFSLAREAVEQALRMLHPDDRFALVVYDTDVDVLAHSTLATDAAKRAALEAMRNVGPRGGTDLCAGWLRGCEQIASTLRGEGIARALLLTDGLANHGETDPEALTRHASELRRRGIATSTFGVGTDFDERLLRDMSQHGGGNFYYVESPVQIPDLLTSELGEALEISIRDAILEIQIPAGASAELMNSYRSTFDAAAGVLRVELDNLASEQELSLVTRIRFAEGREGDRAAVRVTLSGEGVRGEGATQKLEWAYSTDRASDEQARDVIVDREVAAIFAARARAEATEENRYGNYDNARRVLTRTAERVQSYAGRDRELLDLAATLRNEAARLAEEISMSERKEMFVLAHMSAKSRSFDGKARKRPFG